MHNVRGPRGSKVTEPDFSGKISLCPNRPKTVQNDLKMTFSILFQKDKIWQKPPIYQEKFRFGLLL